MASAMPLASRFSRRGLRIDSIARRLGSVSVLCARVFEMPQGRQSPNSCGKVACAFDFGSRSGLPLR